MTKEWPERLVLVGAGKMGGAMAAGWLDGGLAAPRRCRSSSPTPRTSIARSRRRAASPSTPRMRGRRMCWRSRSSRRRSTPSRRRSPRSPASGRSSCRSSPARRSPILRARLPGARAFVRAMPNTPAAIGRGVTAAFASPEVTAEQRRWTERLLGAVGAFHLARRRSRDRRGDGDLGRRPGLCVRSHRGARRRRRDARARRRNSR